MPQLKRKPPKVATSPKYVKVRYRKPVSPIHKRLSVTLKEASNIIRYAQTLFDLMYLYDDHKVFTSPSIIERSERAEIANKLKETAEYLDTLSGKVL
jgi:hypothetical protein